MGVADFMRVDLVGGHPWGAGCTLLNSFLFFFFFFFPSLTAVPSENQCLSSGAYEWPIDFGSVQVVHFESS